MKVANNVTVNWAGTIYRPGDSFEAENDDEIKRWIALGYVSKVKIRRRRKPAK